MLREKSTVSHTITLITTIMIIVMAVVMELAHVVPNPTLPPALGCPCLLQCQLVNCSYMKMSKIMVLVVVVVVVITIMQVVETAPPSPTPSLLTLPLSFLR